MKSLFLGGVGALLVLVVLQDLVERNVLSQGVIAAVTGVDRASVALRNVDPFETTETGQIVVRGGLEGQLIVLIPVVLADKASWRCIGGPKAAVPRRCSE